MPTETEIKIRIDPEDFTSVLKRCSKLYGDAIVTVQRDEYFDTDDQYLKEKDYTVRLRTVNGKAKIALKSPRGFLSNDIYSRLELEFSAMSDQEIREQLVRQHLQPTAILEKRRWKFRGRGELKVTIDKLPFIGCFLEIEAQTPARIEKVLELIQLSATNAVRQNYTELMEAELGNLGLPLRPALCGTFEAESEWVRQVDEN
jgi:predicted adenylyl cyclase CyaB